MTKRITNMYSEHDRRLLRSLVMRLSSFVDQFSSTNRTFDAIKSKVDAIAEHTQATKKNTEPSHPAPVTVNAEFKFPRAITNYYDAKEKKKPRVKIPHPITFTVSVLTLLAVVIYTGMTYKQWQASIAGNTISRNNVVVSQRAYLAGGKVESEPYGISISIVNVGHVPAIITAVNFTYGRARIEKTGAPLLDSKVVQSSTLRSAIMPAPVTNFGMIVTLPIISKPDQLEVNSGKQQLVVDGTITYEAGFNNDDQLPIVDVLRVHTGYNAKSKSWTHVEEGLPINFRENNPNQQQH